MENLIGRAEEQEQLSQAMSSSRNEFIVLYGRRRVGKTFLVRSYFQDRYAFHYVGVHGQSRRVQLNLFRKALLRYSAGQIGNGGEYRDWQEAFENLCSYLERLPSKDRKVLFFDEMPWIDTQRSDFLMALEYFWNSWASDRDDIVLVACGSATSWMKEKLFDNQGGLHNRVTRRMYLRPFNLQECRSYLQSRGFDWDDRAIMQCYMIMGGIPFYLSMLECGHSLQENIDRLFFQRGGMLSSEFDELYSALFSHVEQYAKVIRQLSEKREGLTRAEIETRTGLTGGVLTRVLRNLEANDFLMCYTQFGCKSKGTIYRLCDFYTLFYLYFVLGNSTKDENYWMHHLGDARVIVWEGLTFELLCLMHLSQIKRALGISGIATDVSAWRYVPSAASIAKGLPEKGAQIDLVIARGDKMIHLCELKFSDGTYEISKTYEEQLRERVDIFRRVTGKKHNLLVTFITPWGVAHGKHSSVIQCEVKGEALF